MNNTTKAERNAIEFGHHVGAPGWYAGFLVACSVKADAGNPARSDREPSVDDKIGIDRFAKRARQHHATVKAYLTAWNAAAGDGYVDPSDVLTPEHGEAGIEFDPETHTQDVWLEYFDAAMEPRRAQKRARAHQRAVEDAQRGTTKEKVAEAIKSDPAVALAARRALTERERENKITKPSRQESPIDQFTNLHLQLRSAKRALTESLGYVIDIRGVTDTDETRAAIVGYIEQIRHILDLIDEAAQGQSLDDELAELLADEDIR